MERSQTRVVQFCRTNINIRHTVEICIPKYADGNCLTAKMAGDSGTHAVETSMQYHPVNPTQSKIPIANSLPGADRSIANPCLGTGTIRITHHAQIQTAGDTYSI